MYETPEDVERLQRLLDASYERSGQHLRSIITPARRLSAEDVCRQLQGMTLLSLATVNSRGEPMVSPVDGYFYRGLVWFGSAQNSLRFQHIRKRPAVSATHTRGEELVVTVHGRAVEIDTSTGKYEELREVLRGIYPGFDNWQFWEKAAYAYIEPRAMFAASFKNVQA